MNVTRVLTIAGFAAFCTASTLVPPLGATTLEPRSLEEISERADIIVRGTVQASHGRFDPRHGIVFTHTTVKVREVVKGEVKSAAVQVVSPGGVDAERWSRVEGAPDPGLEGQEVVVFLYDERGGRMSNVVFWQGLFHVDQGLVRQTGEPAARFVERVRGSLPQPSEAGGLRSGSGEREVHR